VSSRAGRGQDGQRDAKAATNMATEKRKNPRKLPNAAKVATVRKRPTTWLRHPALLGGRADGRMHPHAPPHPKAWQTGKLIFFLNTTRHAAVVCG
jgi:hypothetical protein